MARYRGTHQRIHRRPNAARKRKRYGWGQEVSNPTDTRHRRAKENNPPKTPSPGTFILG